MKKSETGVLGETYAAAYLEVKGCRILERNFHSRFGEIDIIAETGNYLCFVEVKTRGPRAIAEPAEFVTPAKQRKIRLTADYYLVTAAGDSPMISRALTALKSIWTQRATLCGFII